MLSKVAFDISCFANALMAWSPAAMAAFADATICSGVVSKGMSRISDLKGAAWTSRSATLLSGAAPRIAGASARTTRAG